MSSKAYFTGSFTHATERTDIPHPFPGQYSVIGAIPVAAAAKHILDIKVRTINPTTLGVTVLFFEVGAVSGGADPAIVPGSGADTVTMMFVPLPP